MSYCSINCVVKNDGTDFRLQEGDDFASRAAQGCEPGQRKADTPVT
ncbi:hypothetical protein BN134_1301 [Cronobacter dublinensis 1210]|uniref:Uncharacterized protein n=1 Tax=Cronobacter dublinensis 1210 TaxID=1208656 RepID=A0ABM9Q594_9ENTR|nr:hypothetical protein BN134_1301 [Cronobacter dublinensis 1210]